MSESKISDQVIPQPDAYTCQSACIAKVLGTQDVYSIRRDLEQLGVPGDPAVMGNYLRNRVSEYRFLATGSLNDARAALSDGYTIITHGWFTPSGHVLTLVDWVPGQGRSPYEFVVDDPWGDFDFPAATYDASQAGDNLPYSAHGIYAYCVAGQSFEHAQELYQAGQLRSAEAGAWLHLVKN